MERRDFLKLLCTLTVDQLVRTKPIPPGLYTNLPSTDILPRVSIPLAKNLEDLLYAPTFKQREFHASTAPNCLIEGSRGTGKSLAIRYDAHMRALATPNFRYLILRRTMPELKKSHLHFMDREMDKLGGRFLKTDSLAEYNNGSRGFFSHCEQEADVLKLLSSEFGAVYFDEITTFPWDMVTKIAACARVPEDSGLIAVVRGGTNPIGIGASKVKQYYVTKTIQAEEDPAYHPDDYQAIHTTLADNPHIDRAQYTKRLSNLPEHIRRAWLNGEWLNEGAYFLDFMPEADGQPWHIIKHLPTVREEHILNQSWIRIYRALDWGYDPDPAVCLWILIMPNGREIVFMEHHWNRTLAADVAKDIVRMSSGMKVIETFADPSLFAKEGGASDYSIGEIIEANKVALTPSINDRALFGYAIHDHLNTLIDERPKMQILSPQGKYGCPDLIRTFPEMRTDSKDAKKIADGDDHWVVALAYYCIGKATPQTTVTPHTTHRWMLPKSKIRRNLYAGPVE